MRAVADVIHGDIALTAAEIVPAPGSAAWTKPAVDADLVAAGQDDIAGGSSRKGYRDGNDTINGDGDDDFVVGDNGTVARIVGTDSKETVYTERYGREAGRPRQGAGLPDRHHGCLLDAVLHGSDEPVADVDLRGDRRLRRGHHPRRHRPAPDAALVGTLLIERDLVDSAQCVAATAASRRHGLSSTIRRMTDHGQKD